MSHHILVISDPAARHLAVLEQLPQGVTIAVGKDDAFLADNAPRADVILNGMFHGDLLRTVIPAATQCKWIHTLSAGVEHVLSPELIACPLPLTNGRGVFKRSLAEWVIAAALYFAKDLRRLNRQQEAGVWEQYDVDELAGATMGIIGYGEIGRATAERARAFGMRIIAIRRNPSLSSDDPLVDATYPPHVLANLLHESDYVVIAAPNTPQTRGMIGAQQIKAMKSNAVLINVGRGAVIVESDLIAALEHNKIRGAALDVFEKEPLPEGHPFYKLHNVLLSPHSADHHRGWLEAAVHMFVKNYSHFAAGEPLENIVDKKAGY